MVNTISYRIDVLRSGAVFTTLRAVEPPRIDCSADAEIKTSMSGTFVDDSSINYFTDGLKPIAIINGVERPLGVFLVSRKTNDISNSTHVTLECYDRGFVLKSTTTEDILHIPARTNYITAIEQLLVSAGLPLYIATPTTATLATAREDWAVGTDYLTIINELLGEINYKEIWFNQDGYAVLEPVSDLTAAVIQHRYGSEIKLLRPEITSEIDLFSQPNVFIVVCDNPERGAAPLVAKAENNNPLSSFSILKRGRRIARTYKVSNVASQNELNALAQRLATASMLQSEKITFNTAIDGFHGVGDVCSINHPHIEGIFEEVSWGLKLSAGESMSHTAQRIIIV